ncbi:MAG: ATP-binding cassette domain-containing protein [Sporolactobacillus sp.]
MNEQNQQLGSEFAVQATGLVKAFGKKPAVDGLDLVIPRGTVYGFLGPNGAGKTTTIRMLSTLLRPDAGQATVMGHDLLQEPEAVRQHISLTGQFASVDEILSGKENLMMIARLMGYSHKKAKMRAEQLLDVFGLKKAAAVQVKKYSGGMRRRIDIAASIVLRPDLLFLDEPTTGLDPRSRNQIWEIIRALVASGTTVLLTTQYLEEADQLADRIAVIDSGRIIAEGTSGELKASIGTGVLHVRLLHAETREQAQQILAATLNTPILLTSDPLTLTAQIQHAELAAKALGELAAASITVTDFSLGQPSLDEVFLSLTGQPADEEVHA